MKGKNGLCTVRIIRVIYSLAFLLLALQIHSCFASSIVTPPSSKIATEGYPVSFECTVAEVPPGVNVSWMQDDQEITNEKIISDAFKDRFEIEITEAAKTYTYRLVLNRVKREDSGFSYKCQINDVPKITSKSVQIDVRQVPGKEYPKCIQPVDNIKEGDMVELECQSEHVKPLPNLEWQYNGKKVSSDQLNSSDSISIKHVFQVTKDRVYNYTFSCVLQQVVVGPERTCSIGPLRILYKPEVDIIGDTIIETNKEHVFICNSPTYPTPKQYKWTFNPPLSHEQYRTESEDMVLRIKHLTQKNDGTTITCEVQNSAGWGVKDKKIQVIVDPNTFNPTLEPIPDKPKPDQSAAPNTYGDMTTAMILSIAGCSLLVLSLLAATLLCYFYMCVRKRYLHGSGYKIAQPDVYSEPRDNLPAPVHTMERVPPWMQRTVGIQVRADLPLEMGEVYTGINKSIEQTKKEEYIKPASRSV
ncbi:hemicentin-2-like [Anneissia japonica]|uniref:hemicentin-2-like n=1 Tax=Anneissia japonica TaxID=1529436 RepID=UPI0014259CB7|nr:hemicentin-2-like [Anneissia japonica]